MTTHGDVRRHVRKRLMGLAATVVVVTVIAVGVLGTAIHKAAKKLPVDPYVALAGGVVATPEREPVQPKLGSGVGEGQSADAVLLRKLSRLRYRDERAVRRFLVEYRVTGPDVDHVHAAQFTDRLEKVLEEDPPIEVRRAVLAVYRRIPKSTLLHDPFAAFLVDPDAELRRLAVLGLRVHDRDARWKTVAELTADPAASVRCAVAMMLGGVRDAVAVDALVGMLFDEDDDVVEAAGVGLGLSLGRELPVRFLDACEHERAAVRLAAANTLRVARGRAAAPILTGFLQDPDWRIRRVAVQGLGRLRGSAAPDAARALQSLAGQVGMPRTDRFEAIQALAAMPELRDTAGLLRIAEKDEDPVLRLVAARAALAHGDVAAVPVLLALLHVEQGEYCDEEDQEFVCATADATLRDALEIEGPEGAFYVEQAARSKLRGMQTALPYSPTRLYEFW